MVTRGWSDCGPAVSRFKRRTWTCGSNLHRQNSLIANQLWNKGASDGGTRQEAQEYALRRQMKPKGSHRPASKDEIGTRVVLGLVEFLHLKPRIAGDPGLI
jgi:hypothetical protein